jgi:glycosyltransferase involved in cell wall biosynthesis
MMFGFGVPVLIGPMNGGMDYPPGFRSTRGPAERLLFGIGAFASSLLNRLMPGKRKAALLLVANERTRRALPRSATARVHELVENGVDLGLWRPVVRARPSTEPALTSFVFMGRLVDWKAVDLLLRAFKLAAGQARIRLLVIGDGVERARLESLAKELGVWSAAEAGSGQVRFAGWLPQRDCAESLLDADCLVLPSILECGGAVVLEAMSMGKPVIATAWGGPLDYLDATCGVLVPPHGPQQLVEGFVQAMVRLANAPSERESMGRAGRAKVQRDYDWEIKADRMLELYQAARLPQGG